MPSSSYSSSFGRLQSLSTNFLSKDTIQNLMKAEDVAEMAMVIFDDSHCILCLSPATGANEGPQYLIGD